MKKYFLMVVLIFSLFIIAGCNNQKTQINGMDIIYEPDETISETIYGEIVDNDIVLYIALPSTMLTPSVSSMKKSNTTLTVQVNATSERDDLTLDMAYWKITIKANKAYVKDIESVNIRIGN